MEMYDSERQIGDDGDSLTEMSEACLSQENTMSLRNQLWDLRYQVQKIQPAFCDQAQKDISFRLARLHQVDKFDAKAIYDIRVRRAIRELMEQSHRLQHDRRRIRRRAQHLLKRLNGTIYAYQRWWGRYIEH